MHHRRPPERNPDADQTMKTELKHLLEEYTALECEAQELIGVQYRKVREAVL